MLKLHTDLDNAPRPIDLPRAEAAVRDLLAAIGEDPTREGLVDTPRRVAKMLLEMFAGRDEEVGAHLGRTFAEPCDEPVVLRGIRFASMCEHHLLPFTGTADVAYLPSDRVVGLSKLARAVHVFARRPQLQERMTREIADALMDHLEARGALVLVRGEHTCMKVRGVGEPAASMVTTTARGAFRDDPALRARVMQLFASGRETP